MERKVTKAEEAKYKSINAEADKADQYISYGEAWMLALGLSENVVFTVVAAGTSSRPEDGYWVRIKY